MPKSAVQHSLRMAMIAESSFSIVVQLHCAEASLQVQHVTGQPSPALDIDTLQDTCIVSLREKRAWRLQLGLCEHQQHETNDSLFCALKPDRHHGVSQEKADHGNDCSRQNNFLPCIDTCQKQQCRARSGFQGRQRRHFAAKNL